MCGDPLARQTHLFSLHAFLGAFLVNPGQLSSDKKRYADEIAPYLTTDASTPGLLDRLAALSPNWLKSRLHGIQRSPNSPRHIRFFAETGEWKITD